LGSLCLLSALGWEEFGLNEGQDTTLGDGDSSEQLVQLFVISDGQLQVSGNDTSLLVVSGGVTSQLQDLSSQVLEDGSEVDWREGSEADVRKLNMLERYTD
jgi:hypothetical protein